MMEIGTEISQKIRSAITAKLIEQGAYVDDELPDYIMVMVANKKSQKQMADDLSLFLGTNTDKFTVWLHGLLKKLQSINTDEPGGKQKPKDKDKHKGEKKKHKTLQGEKEKAVKGTDGEKTKKSSVGEKEKTQKKKLEEKVETSSATVKPVQKVEDEQHEEINISENTDEFNEENKEAERKEQIKSSSTGKPPPTNVAKSEKSTEVKKSSKTASKSKTSSSASKHKGEAKESRKKPTSFVASVKRKYEEIDEEEEYDPANPAVGSVASIVRGPQRKSSVPKSLQANKSLLMKAVTEAEKSVTKASKKPEPKQASSKPSMRSDRQPLELKNRLKTAAGLGLMSRSKRSELQAVKHKVDSDISKDTAKKPRRSSEGFENITYTIKNEPVSLPKSSTKKPPPKPKAPAVAPSRVAASALREMGHTSKKVVVKKELKEPELEEDEVDEEYGPPLPDTRLVQRTAPNDDSTEHTDSSARNSPLQQPSEVSDGVSPDPEIQQLLDEAHETLDLNDDLSYEDDDKRQVKDSSSPSPEPRFIVTLDGVDTRAFPTLPEVRQNPVQPVKPVPKQTPIPDPLPQKVKPIAVQATETTEQIFAKIAPPKIKPFNINLKDTDDEDDGEEMDTTEMETEEPMKTTISERCRFWPACANGNNCQFIHPSIPCKTFPYCKFGDKCVYIHPNCRFDAGCTRMDCPYTHSGKRMGRMPPTVIHKIVQMPMQPYMPSVEPYQSAQAQSIQCRFFPNCINMSCPFIHPKLCRYGIGCMNKNSCIFYHPPLPEADKLRWTSSAKNQSSEMPLPDVMK